MGSDVLGLECKTYYGTAGSTAANLLTKVRDLTMSLEKGEADFTSRASGGWESIRGALKSGSLTFDMVWDTTDAGYQAIRDAFLNNTAIALLILDAAGGEGLDADFEVTSFEVGQPLLEGVQTSFTVKISTTLRNPTWDS